MTQSAVPPPTTTGGVALRTGNPDTPRANWAKARERLAWMMVAPSLLVVVCVALYPLIMTVYSSFTNARLDGSAATEWVGIAQYEFIFNDRNFRNAFQNTLIFTVLGVALQTILGMAIALLIYSNFKGRGLLRTAILVPWAIPTVVSARLWEYMFASPYGVFNDITQYRLPQLVDWIPGIGGALAGLFREPGNPIPFLTDPTMSLFSIIAVDVWKTTPFMALLLLAGLQVIPGDVYEAANIDGASKWRQFWEITLPLLRPALLVALIFRTMDSFRVFDVVYVMKSYSLDTQTLAIYAQQWLVNANRLGTTSAVAFIIFVCIGLMVFGYTKLVKVEEN
ncbi:MAG TPA: sugar ABC transporter permease [Thermomicrobiales bacterium]|jgi:trehalose/maltose transport system permease protein|nr:sugar ABC transporter permease [Thermomicrobiales bacterium]